MRIRKENVMTNKYTLPALLAVALLAGCSMAPTYQRPAAPVSGQWPSGPAYGGEAA